jgi:hypothetical protein
MTKSARLNDLQMILLSAASARPDGDLLPLPDSIAGDRDRSGKPIAPLLKRGLVEERPVAVAAPFWRHSDGEQTGLFITDAGIALIAPDADSAPTSDVEAEDSAASATRAPTKTACVLELLRRDEGATLDALVAATKWLPHTTRAALTGLRKKGHAIDRDKIDGVTRYKIKPMVAE